MVHTVYVTKAFIRWERIARTLQKCWLPLQQLHRIRKMTIVPFWRPVHKKRYFLWVWKRAIEWKVTPTHCVGQACLPQAWCVVLRSPSAWTVSPGGSGMLMYLRLRETSKDMNRCVAGNWVALITVWRTVPRLQSGLSPPSDFEILTGMYSRLMHLERTIRIMCEHCRLQNPHSDNASVNTTDQS